MSRHAAPPDKRRLALAWGAFLAATLFVVGSLWVVLEPNPDAPRSGVMPTGTPSQSGRPKPSVSTTKPKASKPASRPSSTRPTRTPAPTPTRPPVTRPSPSQTFASTTYQALYLINGERKEAGAAAVARYPGMDAYAQDWADEMARADILVHSPHNPYSAEVIAVGSGGMSATQAVNVWMQSPPHREIILNPAYTKVGIGYADGYWCAVFS